MLHSGQWISMQVITADVKLGTGGKVLDFKKCKIARRQPADLQAAGGNSFNATGKDANHNHHFTRNIELPNGDLRKIHPILITKINNQPVI